MITHNWRAKGDGASYTSNLETIGLVTPPVLLDPYEWLNAPASERSEYIFSIAGDQLKEFDINRVLAIIKSGIVIDKPTADSERALAGLSDAILKHLNGETRPQIASTAILEFIKEKKKALKADAASNQRQADGIVANRARAGVAPVENVDAKVRKVNLDLQNQIGVRESIKVKIDNIRANEARIERLMALASEEATPDERLKEKQEQLHIIRKGLDELSVDLRKYVSKTLAISERQRGLLLKLEKDNPRLIAERQRMAAALDKFYLEQAGDECPCCAMKGSAWKESHAAKFKIEEESINSAINAIQNEINETVVGIDTTTREHAESIVADGEWADRRDAFNVADKAFHAEAKDLLETTNSSREVIAARKELETITTGGNADELAENLAASERDIERLRQEALTTALAQKKWVAFCTEQKSLDQATANVLRFEAELEVWAEAEKATKVLHAKMIESVFGSILAKANLFTDGILRTPLEFRDGQLGRLEKSLWIPYTAFSGLEKAVTFAGLSVALAQSSPIKVVLVDELIVSPANKPVLISRMNELASAGVIDHFVVVDVSAHMIEWGAIGVDLNVIEA